MIKKDTKSLLRKVLKIIGWTLAGLVVLFLLLVLIIRTPWAQDKITTYATNYVEKKTGTTFSIEKLFITFKGEIHLSNLYIEDLNGDTLVYSKELVTGIKLLPLLTNKIKVSHIDWTGLIVRLVRPEGEDEFNYDFLIQAFKRDSVKVETDDNTLLPDLQSGLIKFRDFDLEFLDHLQNRDLKINLGSMDMLPTEINLNTLTFDIKDVEIANTQVVYKQSGTMKDPSIHMEVDRDTTTTPLSLKIDNIHLINSYLDYDSAPDNMAIMADIGDFTLNLPLLNLSEQKIDISEILMNDSKIRIQLPENTETERPPPNDLADVEDIIVEFPNWDIGVKHLFFKNNQIEFYQGQQRQKASIFSSNQLDLSNVQMEINDFKLDHEKLEMVLNHLSFKDRSGLTINDLTFSLTANTQKIDLNRLKIITPRSNIHGTAIFTYANLDALIHHTERSKASIEIYPSTLSLLDALYFQPDLARDRIIGPMIPFPIRLNSIISGEIGNLRVEQFDMNGLRQTRLRAKGTLTGLPNMDNLYFDFPMVQLQSIQRDIGLFYVTDTSGYTPATLNLKGNVTGTPQNLKLVADISIPEGNIKTDLKYKLINDIPQYEGTLSLHDLQSGTILNNKDMGKLSADIQFNGTGTDLYTMDMQIKGKINEFIYNEQPFVNTTFDGHLKDGRLTSDIEMDEKHAKLTGQVTAHLDSLNQQYNADLEVRHFDPYALGLYKQEFNFSGNLALDFKGGMENFESSLSLKEGLIKLNNKHYPLEQLDATVSSNPETTEVLLSSNIIDANFSSNTSIGSMVSVLENHVKKYYLYAEVDSIASSGIVIQGKVDLKDDPILREILLPKLDSFSTSGLIFSLDQDAEILKIDWNWAYISYAEWEMKDMNIQVVSDPERLDYDIGFLRLEKEPISIYKTAFSGYLQDNTMHLTIDNKDSLDAQLFLIQSITNIQNDTFTTHIIPDNLLLNNEQWSLSQGNEVKYVGDRIAFNDFTLSFQDQFIYLQSDESRTDDHLNLRFENFKISTISTIINPKDPPVDGMLFGEIFVENLLTAPVFLADARIDDLVILDNDMGQLLLVAEHAGTNKYEVDIIIHEGAADLTLTGFYSIINDKPDVNLDANIISLDLSILEPFLKGEIEDLSGNLSGNLSIVGDPTQPVFEGALEFEDAKLKVVAVNETFTLSREQVILKNEGIFFDQFTITDSQDKTGKITGHIGIEKWKDPTLHLDVVAENFRLLNSTRQENDLYYGTILVDADFKLRGMVSAPIVNATMRLNRGTDLTFIVPESQIAMVEKEGIVLFVDMSDPDQQLQEETKTRAELSGIDLNAVLEIDSNTVFTIIIDERTGDYITVNGFAKLNLNISPNGEVNLYGTYEVTKGRYELNMYDLVRRRFDFVPGSRITWAGDPSNAVLDLSAIYSIRTSPADLMADQLSGSDPALANSYRQEMPFLIYLYIKGELVRPQISFRMDMPEAERGIQGGNVYSRINQLNQNDSELNKQVFGLLVLNRFLPQDFTSRTGASTSAMARSSVSQILSNQLNTLSGRYLQGVDLEFDLDSYTDYQSGSAQDRTLLNLRAKKALLDERLIVSIGSRVDLEGEQSRQNQNPSDIIGDISLEYLITKDGKYRIRGFRRNEFEGLVEGQLIVTGLSFIYNREFNTLRELLKKPIEVIPEVKRPEQIEEIEND